MTTIARKLSPEQLHTLQAAVNIIRELDRAAQFNGYTDRSFHRRLYDSVDQGIRDIVWVHNDGEP